MLAIVFGTVMILGCLFISTCLIVLTFTVIDVRRVATENSKAIRRIEAAMKEHRC